MRERARRKDRIRPAVRLANEAFRSGPKGLSVKGIGPCLMYGRWGFSRKMHKEIGHLCVLRLLWQRFGAVGGPSVEIHPKNLPPKLSLDKTARLG